MVGSFDYLRPQSLAEALEFLHKQPETCRVLAGGTDLLVLIRRSVASPAHLLDIKALPETGRFEYTLGEGLLIGAAVTVNRLAESPLVREKYPALADAAGALATYQVRNRATLVGNICNASPGSDLAPALLVFEARVRVKSLNGSREIPIDEFFTGVKKTVLKPDELVTEVFLPDPGEGDKSVYLKQGRVKGHDLAVAGVAVRLTGSKKLCLAVSALAPAPLRLRHLEEMLNAVGFDAVTAEKAALEVEHFIRPISDIRASAEYRKHIAAALLKRAIRHCEGGGKSA